MACGDKGAAAGCHAPPRRARGARRKRCGYDRATSRPTTGLARRGWSEGRNIRIDYRYAPAGANAQTLAKELVASQPDVILGHTVTIAAALQRETRTIPVVFVSLADPIGSGFVNSLARPGGNMTGLMTFEPSIAGKWCSMLKEVNI